MKLAIVGSVNINEDQKLVSGAIISGIIVDFHPKIIISGGAKGIDSQAEEKAYIHRVPTKIHLPENDRWEPQGYKDRNILIAEDCTHLLCIRSQQSKSYGSGWTADHAQKIGKTVWRVTL